ncbi:MAG: SDR family NAD(P)-dependent oxidoreductase [Clostridia bacterium]|nr:SDR family NAD(P)-dependent oxidoreductase [Clostridia bacterium]MBQ8512254.1 SDR family NAD(P)-dependent oxidoreductase [Clostridia bacterium]
MEFRNKTAIASGAASGMGLLFSECWTQAGGNVVMCDVNEDKLSEKVAEINAAGNGRAVGVLCDEEHDALATKAQPNVHDVRIVYDHFHSAKMS